MLRKKKAEKNLILHYMPTQKSIYHLEEQKNQDEKIIIIQASRQRQSGIVTKK